MRRGFTLIEALVAMTILVIVVSSTMAIFHTSASSWRKGEMRAQRYQRARFILERMGKEISSIAPVSLAGPYCLGDIDRFYFISSSFNAPASLIELGYWLDRDTQNLMRSFQSLPDYDFSTFEKEEPLCEDVSDLNFQYFTGGTWLENWDSRPGATQSGLLPRAVRIEFVLRDEQASQEESFDTVVTLPVSKY